jgi:iron complex outermembrane receptor protein
MSLFRGGLKMRFNKTKQCLSVTAISIGMLTILFVPLEAVKAEGFALEEIVVTARKREESLQDAPLSISAFTQNELKLRNIVATDQLGEVTPNLTFDSYAPSSGSNASSQIFIRGIGQTDFTAVTDPGVGLYVDGVYMARSMGGAMNFLDLEQIEVLKGPQGTLFGRNTIGGAVLLRTAKPAENFGGNVEVQIGDDNMLNVGVNVDVPLSDTLYGKMSLSSNNRDGYVTRINGGDNLGDDSAVAGRIRLLWKAADNLEFDLIADYTKEDENGAPSVTVGLNEQAIFAHLSNSLFNSACPLTPPPDEDEPDTPPDTPPSPQSRKKIISKPAKPNIPSKPKGLFGED